MVLIISNVTKLSLPSAWTSFGEFEKSRAPRVRTALPEGPKPTAGPGLPGSGRVEACGKRDTQRGQLPGSAGDGSQKTVRGELEQFK